MRKKIKKQIDKKATSLLIEWLKNLIGDDEEDPITEKNFKELLPIDEYIQMKRTCYLPFFTFRWATQTIKKLLRKGAILDEITMEDLQWVLKKRHQNTQSNIL